MTLVESERPEWVDELIEETAKPHAVVTGFGRAFREWLGLGIAALLAWLVVSGLYSLNAIEERVQWTAKVQGETKQALDAHIQSANAANLALSRILSRIESRTSRLEGIEEGRGSGGNGG